MYKTLHGLLSHSFQISKFHRNLASPMNPSQASWAPINFLLTGEQVTFLILLICFPRLYLRGKLQYYTSLNYNALSSRNGYG